ncbi:MAG: arginine--tRNA ligase [Candidatus Pacebacteria bacterium]|nr:arginine--tRNA ligase [Candidatus Paceibacterota bacterium]MBP9840034.1 arginine--tRNA ligase [Candidatus Paceibacterota bacterium]
MEERIRKAVEEALIEMGVEGTSFAVEWPGDLTHGDYATNAAMAAAKKLGRNPQELAGELATKVAEILGDLVTKVEAAGPGFVNITLSPASVRAEIEHAAKAGESLGRTKESLGKRVIVEYSCPNPMKEMHVGHLMSTVIGEAVARVIESGSATVIRDSYGGDVGPHIAKALWALRKDGVTEPANSAEIGKAYAHGSQAYEKSEEAKAEIDALNQEIYKGEDPGLMDLWRRAREVSLEAFYEIYALMGTKFDYFFFESETAEPGMRIVKEGLAKGVFEESEGAIIYKGEKKGLHTLVFITSRDTPTYEAKDIGLAFLKEERVPSDESIILTAAEQSGHFAVFLAALEDIAPLVAKKTRHIPHGFLRLTSGKMSSREGTVITAKEIIDEVIEKAKEKNEDSLVAEQVAVGALKYMILRQAPGGDIIFDPEKSLSLEGDSGPYLQYALVRALKVLTYDNKSGGGETPAEPYTIERLLLRFPGVCARARQDSAPHHIAQYLTQLASAWNAFYATEQILGSPEEAYKQQVARAFANTMRAGFSMLGIPAPERM